MSDFVDAVNEFLDATSTKKMADAIKNPETEKNAPQPAEAEATPEEPLEAELVVEALCPNTQIVLAKWIDAGLKRVRVRDSKNFVKGMKVPCRHVRGDLWELVGALPRSRGRW